MMAASMAPGGPVAGWPGPVRAAGRGRFSMRLGTVSAVPAGAALAGFLLGAALFASRPVGAQFSGTPRMGQPLVTPPASAQAPASPAPQPIEIQALDSTHFVVATREPRLVQQVGNPGTA